LIVVPATRVSRVRDDGGVAAAIVLFPIFFAVVFMFVQGVFWQNARTAASTAADHAAQAVALFGAPAGEAQAEAAAMAQSAGLRNVNVSVDRGGRLTVAVVTGRAPGIIAGTSITVTARSVAPTEGVRTP
jgi:hypothetical protein